MLETGCTWLFSPFSSFSQASGRSCILWQPTLLKPGALQHPRQDKTMDQYSVSASCKLEEVGPCAGPQRACSSGLLLSPDELLRTTSKVYKQSSDCGE